MEGWVGDRVDGGRARSKTSNYTAFHMVWIFLNHVHFFTYLKIKIGMGKQGAIRTYVNSKGLGVKTNIK